MSTPTILPCPNPKCGGECTVAEVCGFYVFCGDDGDHDGCGYDGPDAKTREEAIELHNAMPRGWLSLDRCLPTEKHDLLLRHDDGSVTAFKACDWSDSEWRWEMVEDSPLGKTFMNPKQDQSAWSRIRSAFGLTHWMYSVLGENHG